MSYEISNSPEDDAVTASERPDATDCWQGDGTEYFNDPLEYLNADCSGSGNRLCNSIRIRGLIHCRDSGWRVLLFLFGECNDTDVIFEANTQENICGTTLVLDNELTSDECCDGSTRDTITSVPNCADEPESIRILGYGGSVTLESSCP